MEENNNRIDVIEILLRPAGSKIYKCDLREILGVNRSGWRTEIKALCIRSIDFSEKYEPFRPKNSVSISLAKEILEEVFAGTGDEIKVKFEIEKKEAEKAPIV